MAARQSRWFSWLFGRKSYQRVNVEDNENDDFDLGSQENELQEGLTTNLEIEDQKLTKSETFQEPTKPSFTQSANPITATQTTPTPLPKLQVALVACTLYGQQFSQNVLFPFLPFMVHSFFPELSVNELGYYAGYLGAAFSVGNVVSAYIWGKFADTYGRRPCVLLGILGTVASMIAFGMSPTFKIALIARFFGGSLNGNNGICKTMISEMTDNTNSARGFSIIGLLGGLARLTAPGIGGLLSQPSLQYPGSFLDTDFNRDHPFALPCLIGAFVAFASFMTCFFLLEETYPLNKRLEVMQQQKDQSLSSANNTNSSGAPPAHENSLWGLLTNPGVSAACTLTAILSFLGVTQTEVFPLWVINDEDHGGFNFRASAIGTILTILGPIQILHQLFFYPALANYFGFRGLFMTGMTTLGIACAIMPNTYYIQHFHSRTLAWVAVVAAFVLMVLSRVTCFTCTFVLLNNAAQPAIRASANGLAQTMGSITGMLGPLVGSLLFAWSLNNNLPWPLNFHFIWILLTIICIIGHRVASILPNDSPLSTTGTHSRLSSEDPDEADRSTELTTLRSKNDYISDLSDDDMFVLQNLVEYDSDDQTIEDMQRLSLSRPLNV